MTKLKSQALYITRIKYWNACGSVNPPFLIPSLWLIKRPPGPNNMTVSVIPQCKSLLLQSKIFMAGSAFGGFVFSPELLELCGHLFLSIGTIRIILHYWVLIEAVHLNGLNGVMQFLKDHFFCNRRYSLLSFSGPQLYNLGAMPFTYSVCCYD